MQLILRQIGNSGDHTIAEEKEIQLFPEFSERITDAGNAPTLVVTEDAQYQIRVKLETGERKVTVYLNAEDDSNAIGIAVNSGILREPDDLTKTLKSAPIFLGQVDIIRFCVQVEYSDGVTSQWLFSDDILCAFKDYQDTSNVRQIIEYLLNFDDEYINDILYANAPAQTGNAAIQRGDLQRYCFKSLPSYIEIIRKISLTYHQRFHFFQNKAHYKLEPRSVMMDGMAASDVSSQTINWISQNMGTLAPVSCTTGIRFKTQSYLPTSLEAETYVHSRNVYENKVVLGFLKNVLQNTHRILSQLDKGIKANNSYISALSKEVGVDYQENLLAPKPPIVIVRQLICARQESFYTRLKKLKEELSELYSRYKTVLKCEDVAFSHLPRPTKFFLQSPAYREIYQHIIQWYKYGEFCLSGTNLTFRIKNFTKLFEYYCLLRIIEKIISEGFVLTKRPYSYQYPKPHKSYAMEQEVCNTYCFEKGGLHVTLYYEPVLYGYIPEQAFEPATLMPNDVGLVRSRSIDGRKNYWEPDFVVKIEHDSISEYVILDAKFSKTDSILRTYPNMGKYATHVATDTNETKGKLKEIIDKYYVDTVALGNGYIRMVWTLQGRSNSNFFEYGNLLSPFAELGYSHSFGNCPLNSNPEIDNLQGLWDKMQKMIPALQKNLQSIGGDESHPIQNEESKKAIQHIEIDRDNSNSSQILQPEEDKQRLADSPPQGLSIEPQSHNQQEAPPSVSLTPTVDFCFKVWEQVEKKLQHDALVKPRTPSFNHRPPIRKEVLSNIYKASKNCSISMKIAAQGLMLLVDLKHLGADSTTLKSDAQQKKCETILRSELGKELSCKWDLKKQTMSLSLLDRNIPSSAVNDPVALADYFVSSCQKLAMVLTRDFKV